MPNSVSRRWNGDGPGAPPRSRCSEFSMLCRHPCVLVRKTTSVRSTWRPARSVADRRSWHEVQKACQRRPPRRRRGTLRQACKSGQGARRRGTTMVPPLLRFLHAGLKFVPTAAVYGRSPGPGTPGRQCSGGRYYRIIRTFPAVRPGGALVWRNCPENKAIPQGIRPAPGRYGAYDRRSRGAALRLPRNTAPVRWPVNCMFSPCRRPGPGSRQ